MKNSASKVTSLAPNEFPASRDPHSAQLIAALQWFSLDPQDSQGSWEADVVWTRKCLVDLIDKQRSENVEVFLSIYGAFVDDGLLAVASALINVESCARFCFPAVKSLRPIPGYVESFMNIEHDDGSIDRVFDKAGGVLVGTGNRLSVFVIPAGAFGQLAALNLTLDELYGAKLSEDPIALLEQSKCVMLMNQDFDHIIVGSKKDIMLDLRAICGETF